MGHGGGREGDGEEANQETYKGELQPVSDHGRPMIGTRGKKKTGTDRWVRPGESSVF